MNKTKFKVLTYLKSLLKYILVIVLLVSLLVVIQLNVPQEKISLTYNQGIFFCVVGIVLMAIMLKQSNKN